MEIVDKHSPFKTKRISKKHSPWITYDLMRKIRNYLTEKKDIENNTASWEQYKQARNEANNAIKSAKRQYFLHNLELNKKNSSKTWKLINELSWRKSCKNRNITEIKTDNETRKKLNQSGNLKSKSNIYLSHWTLTRQSCKTVCQ